MSLTSASAKGFAPSHLASSLRRPGARLSALLPAVLAGLAVLGGLLPAPAARAGVTNPNHRMERIGRAIADPAALLPAPGLGRMLVFSRSGELRLTAGDGLVSELVGTIPAAQACPGDGVQSATWHPGLEGQVLYVSYVGTAPRQLRLDRVVIDGWRVTDRTTLYQVNAGADCTNLGGGLAYTTDGKLLLGVGDMGNSVAAGQVTQPHGKIMRLNLDGTRPSDNPVPGSMVYGQGVRNPVRVATDHETGESYFLDIGPGVDDELNRIVRLGNYGWPTGTGVLGAAGMTDPIHVWNPVIGPAGLVAYRADHFGRDYPGDFLVSGRTTSTITRIDTNNGVGAPLGSENLFVRDSGSPQSWIDAAVGPDGQLYLLDGNGELFRLRSAAGVPSQPSSRTSVVPMLVRKLDADTVEIAVEKQPGATDYGIYKGAIEPLRTTGYTHGDQADEWLPGGMSSMDDAWERLPYPMAGLNAGDGGSPNSYLVMSAVSSGAESGTGEDSNGNPRPGGNQTFLCETGCEDPSTWGKQLNQCRIPYTLDRGLMGAGNEIGPINFNSDFTCSVILMKVSAEWCNPCRNGSLSSEQLYQQYKDQGFVSVDLIPEDRSGAAATFATITRWVQELGLTFPVLLDEGYRTWNQYWAANGCNGWPHVFLFDRNGKQVEFWCGYSPTVVSNAVAREMNRPYPYD